MKINILSAALGMPISCYNERKRSKTYTEGTVTYKTNMRGKMLK
jgi:hypothetical protein